MAPRPLLTLTFLALTLLPACALPPEPKSLDAPPALLDAACDSLGQIRPGMSIEEFFITAERWPLPGFPESETFEPSKDRGGSRPKHSCTVGSQDRRTATVFTSYIGPGTSYEFTFLDGSLAKVAEPTPYVWLSTTDKEGRPVALPRPEPYEARARRTVTGPGIPFEHLPPTGAESIRRHEERDRAARANANPLLGLRFVPDLSNHRERFERHARNYASVRERQSAHSIPLGTRGAAVVDRLGPPRRTQALGDGDELRLYGPGKERLEEFRLIGLPLVVARFRNDRLEALFSVSGEEWYERPIAGIYNGLEDRDDKAAPQDRGHLSAEAHHP